jgi:hypothetical protein
MWAQEDTGMTVGGADGWISRTEQASHVHGSLDKPCTASGNYTASMTSGGSEAFIAVFIALNHIVATGGLPVIPPPKIVPQSWLLQ